MRAARRARQRAQIGRFIEINRAAKGK